MPDPQALVPDDASLERLLKIEQAANAAIAWIKAFRVTGATFRVDAFCSIDCRQFLGPVWQVDHFT